MATKKVTALTAASDVTDADLLYVIDGATSKKVTAAIVKTYMSSGIAGTYTALSAAPIVGATTVSVDNVPSGLTSDLLWVVIDMGTSECEVRKATTVSGTTCTVAALQYAHAIDDPVFLTWNPDIYVEWFGAQGDGTTDDTTALTRAIVQATRPLNNHRVVRLPGNEYLVSSTIAIAAYGLVLIGARTRRPISDGSETGATRINFTGSGALFQIGTTSGNPYDTAEYDGYHGWTMRDLALKFTGTTDTALNNGQGNYKANTIGIQDWRGGEVNLDNVWIEAFHWGFWGIQSDQSSWNNVMLRYNKVGAYFGPRSSQLTAIHCGSLYNDTVFHLDYVYGHNFYGCRFIGDGSATDYPIKIGSAGWSNSCHGVNFNGCWFEHYQGYSEIEAFVSIGKGDSIDTVDVTFRECLVFCNPVVTPRAKYFVEVDRCDGIYISQLGGVPNSLTNIISYVDHASHVIFEANRDYTLPICYDDNSGGSATPLVTQKTVGCTSTVHDLWFQDNAAAAQSAVALARTDHVGSAPDAYVNTLINGRAGRVRFVYVKLSENRSAGSLTITLQLDGVAQAMTAVISSATSFAVSAVDAIDIAAASRLGLTITTSADWAPTTADLRAGMIVETY